MRYRSRSTVPLTAAALAASLALAGCGSSGNGGGSGGKIHGADDGGKSGSSAPAKASPSAKPAADHPQARLPADVRPSFDPASSGDPAAKAVLADNQAFLAAYLQSLTDHDLKGPIAAYATGPAADWVAKNVATYRSGGWTVTGTDRFSRRTATVGKDGTATVSFCEDQSTFFAKKKSTGKVRKTPVTANSYSFWATSLKKSPDGIWQTTAVNVKEREASCRG